MLSGPRVRVYQQCYSIMMHTALAGVKWGYVGYCVKRLLCEHIVERMTHIVIIQDFDMDKLISNVFAAK